jgi:hypothetical protein
MAAHIHQIRVDLGRNPLASRTVLAWLESGRLQRRATAHARAVTASSNGA